MGMTTRIDIDAIRHEPSVLPVIEDLSRSPSFPKADLLQVDIRRCALLRHLELNNWIRGLDNVLLLHFARNFQLQKQPLSCIMSPGPP